MIMFESIGRSWEITKRSFAILMEEKKLLLFPFLSGLAMLALLASFIIPVIFLNSNVMAFLLLFLFYFAANFAVVFFNVALTHAAGEKSGGRQVSLVGSISFAFTKILSIAGWSVFSATVGLIISMIRSMSRNKGIGGLIASLIASAIGIAWSFASFLVVPVMVFENKGPFAALTRSVELLKSTWSEQAWGSFGISGITFLLYLPAIGLGVLLAALGQIPLLLMVLPALIIYIAFIAILTGALEGVFTAELYRFAATGKTDVFGDILAKGRIAPAPVQIAK
jgi:hypothetical protein